MKELEAERDELKEQALKLSQEKDTLNDALTEAQGAVISKAGELSEANNSIKDLKLKLEGLEKVLSEANILRGDPGQGAGDREAAVEERGRRA